MKIIDDYLTKRSEFDENNIIVPSFDQEEVRVQTKKTPEWVHFGGGNLYRCFHAKIASDLLNQQRLKTGIVLVETFGEDIINEVYRKNQNRSLTVTMEADGNFDKELIASTAESLFLGYQEDINCLREIFEAESLKLVTLTITEKGYVTRDSHGNLSSQAAKDIKTGPVIEKLISPMGQLTYFVYRRYLKKEIPLALVSTDNFSHNGQRLKEAIMTIANGWLELGFVDKKFLNYVSEERKISYPFSMIDRITPIPNEDIAKELEAEGIEDMMPFVSEKQGMKLASFVNTEKIHYLVVEDHFPNGRPALEEAGVILTDRDTVNKADLMKVCTCLNPLHTALAVYGSLLGFNRIYDESQDADLRKLIDKIGSEGLKVVENPGIIDPKDFIKEVIEKRFSNPNIPDTPQRIASDTSQKVGIRFGETIKNYVKSSEVKVEDLKYIPLVIAGWLRYLMGINDELQSFEVSPDPLLEELQDYVGKIEIGMNDKTLIHECLNPILSNEVIFGLNLCAIGMSDLIEQYFIEMIQDQGSVRSTLHKYVTE
ncbi:mannitol dehydrogenase family protein [Bacillus cytotoxicus]|uniref:Fructuronate reductase n=1 Tax=Bacillus cytotoxicus TaxID=580165 RepID=A0AAX2CM75_9BACI|nr:MULTISPECIES: mannitol dehydrogenase family protein [Bacillus cereus group]MDH2860958.1 mannitol dehydrogenase family protein [Bacillus cytotoxicus]MDH2870590.1 mannitol dehydrogenase family protein [Bacillus cytotoxicus]MDH2877016.1 mannitol dehydrogenase family protein [Bacillus cytotoxicus]MDH2891438.1 mannitol dehydrogenase family protein [Bacillus cytotoxicus]MDH2920496.1 mannitol dehydrogenase family protein [Bacillus cytotoxicus]